MKKPVFCFLLFLNILVCFSQKDTQYTSLDNTNPITFTGETIVYKRKTIPLGPKAFFIDGQLSDKEALKYPFVYNSINEASKDVTHGSATAPMTLYIAPYVYWIDNPNDKAIRVPKEGDRVPYGLTIKCEWLKFYGLTDNAENVVIAANRGQTIGAQGNFTLFKFSGDGTSSENLTFGNYCNIDLNFPLKPELNRKKRASAIVQAQLIHCDGDKIVARNTRFISRLNLNPFVGAKRVLFDRCHFESTDDALCGTAVYLNCTLDFHSSKPFYWTRGTGSIFLNSNINALTNGRQYFTKANGQLALVDTNISSKTVTYVGWNDAQPIETRNYQQHTTINKKSLFIGAENKASTVDMTGLPLLDAYKFKLNDSIIYNTYNLLRGDDDWDPMNLKETILLAEKKHHKNYSLLPIQLLLSSTRDTIETNKDTITLSAEAYRFGNYKTPLNTLKWSLSPGQKSYANLIPSKNGLHCQVIPKNTTNESKEIHVIATTNSGLEAASVIYIAPSKLPAPNFRVSPKITKKKNGTLKIKYALNTTLSDQSLVTWYRCANKKGDNPIEVAVSRLKEPLLTYELSRGDIGYYIMTSVAPKHSRSDTEKSVSIIYKKKISERDVKTNQNTVFTDFKNISLKNSDTIIPGFWTFKHYKNINNNNNNAWFYGKGSSGNANKIGLLQSGRSATMLYTPKDTNHSDMSLKLTVSPFKTAGQGFSIANLYMDVLIKFDTKTMSGYALRFIRTTKYHNAVDAILLEYKNGTITEISKPLSTSTYKTPCKISINITGNKITAQASSINSQKSNNPEIVSEVYLETTITPNQNGGFGILYNGGANAMIDDLKVEWKK